MSKLTLKYYCLAYIFFQSLDVLWRIPHQVELLKNWKQQWIAVFIQDPGKCIFQGVPLLNELCLFFGDSNSKKPPKSTNIRFLLMKTPENMEPQSKNIDKGITENNCRRNIFILWLSLVLEVVPPWVSCLFYFCFCFAVFVACSCIYFWWCTSGRQWSLKIFRASARK